MIIRSRALEPRWILSITFFIAGFFMGGLGTYLWVNTEITGLTKIHPLSGHLKYINPLFAVELGGNTKFLPNKSLQTALSGIVEQAKNDGRISHASVYFRDLEPGFWAGVNENGKFSPGKLLKIPIMITYYRLAEADPGILDQRLSLDGQFYSVDELIEKMIVNSDDEAANTLFDNADKTSLNEIFSDLGIDFKENRDTQDFISLRLYSLFFRILYNATYLDSEFSAKAMDLLVKTESNIGFSVTLPKNIPVANREGLRVFKDGNVTMYETHDCGIVFYPGHPYLLCGFAQSRSRNKLQGFFESLGEMVYKEVNYEYASSKQ